MSPSIAIPPNISHVLLPEDTLNILALSKFSVPSQKNAPNLLALYDNDLFSKTASLIEKEDQVAFLQSLAMPSTTDIAKLRDRRDIALAYNEEIQALSYPLSALKVRLPLWILEYWTKAHHVLEAKDAWCAAISWLRGQKHQEAINLLTQLPWAQKMPKRMADEVADLALLCSERWLRTPQLDILSTILNDQLSSAQLPEAIQPTSLIQKLIDVYRHTRNDYYTDKSIGFVRDLAEKMTTGEVPIIGTPVAVCLADDGVVLPNARAEVISNHWCAFVINSQQHTWFYGDPLGHPPPSELVEILGWWLELSFGTAFTFHTLHTTQQADGISCSILAINALAHHFLPHRPLLQSGVPCLFARVESFMNAVILMKKLVRYFVERL